MKRFVTYLFECEKGKKIKNVGFIRVKAKEQKTKMELYIRNIPRGNDIGMIYALIYKEELQGIPLGEVQINGGQSEREIEFETNNIMESGCTLSDIEGIGICLKSKAYIVSCWRDTYEEKMLCKEFLKQKEQRQEVLVQEKIEDTLPQEMTDNTLPQEESPLAAAEDIASAEINTFGKDHPERIITYEKMDLSQMKELPSPNWHLSTNSFLLHGYTNYGYLVLKKEITRDEKTLSLGVPGVFEKPEAVMAVLFGFPKFEEIAQNETQEKAITESTEPKVGTFGCWFVELKE